MIPDEWYRDNFKDIYTTDKGRMAWVKTYYDELRLIAVFTCPKCKNQELSAFRYCPNCGTYLGCEVIQDDRLEK